MLACGEVRTCLLQHSQALPGTAAAGLLRLRAGQRVLLSERPNPYALSPEVLTGVDCNLPTASGAKVRAVGTVTARAALTEGRLLQADAFCAATADGPDRRRPWGHYLARPGIVEPFGKLPDRDVADGCLAGAGKPGELDLGAVAERVLRHVLRDPALDRAAPFRAQVTRLRWVALRAPDGAASSIENFTVAQDGLRTVELRLTGESSRPRRRGSARTSPCTTGCSRRWYGWSSAAGSVRWRDATRWRRCALPSTTCSICGCPPHVWTRSSTRSGRCWSGSRDSAGSGRSWCSGSGTSSPCWPCPRTCSPDPPSHGRRRARSHRGR